MTVWEDVLAAVHRIEERQKSIEQKLDAHLAAAAATPGESPDPAKPAGKAAKPAE